MNNKDKNKNILYYGDYLCILAVFLFSVYALYSKNNVGIIGIILCILMVFLIIKKKKSDEEILKDKIQNLSLNCNKLTRKTLLSVPLPLCFLELNGEITWANKSFNRMVGIEDNTSSVGLNIENLIGNITLRKVLDENKVIEEDFEFKGRRYLLKYSFTKMDDESDGSADYRVIMYWIDQTELIKARQDCDDTKEAVLIVEIDGYEEVLKSTPEEKRPLLAMEIETLIANLGDQTGSLVEKIATDKYILFMRRKSVLELENNKFSILDKAKEIEYGNKLPITFSIGGGYDGDTIEETGDFASGALDMALGRGGDQAAIKNKKGFNFYGGKSKGFERKTKVKSRLIGLALKELINQSEKILIMGHKYPDMDAMGAAVGVYDLCKNYGKEANVVLENIGESVEIFINRLKENPYYENMFVDHEKAERICDRDTLVIVVDTHRPAYTEYEGLLDLSDRVVVIDHHRRGVDYINDTVLLFHAIYVSSTCEMVTELIQYTDNDSDMKINKLTAEGLLGGIYLDTKNFEFKTGVRTFEAASFLRNMGADTILVKQFFNSYAEDFLVKADIIKRTEIIDQTICISYSYEEIDNVNIVIAKAADELLNIKNIKASFVLGKKGDTIFVSARSLGDINVHIMMEKIGGGGHMDIAGAQLKNIDIDDAYNMVKEIIENYIEEEKK